MSSPVNKLSPETIFLTESVGGWINQSNAAVVRQPHFHPYHVPFSSSVQGNSLRVTPIMAATCKVETESQSVTPGINYKASVWVTGTSAVQATIKLYVLDDLAADVSPATYSTTVDNTAWSLLNVEAELDPDADNARIEVTFTSPAANDVFFLAQPNLMEMLSTSQSIMRTYNNLPDYLLEADKSLTVLPTLPLLRFISLGAVELDKTADDVVDWDYLRATDAEDGIGYLSKLGDPNAADAEWLGWLAQQVGLRLHLPDGGQTTWEEFVEASILDWDHWDGSGPSNPFVGYTNYDSAAVQGVLDDFRRQIEYGTNGILSSSNNTISGYIGSLLNQIDPTPWVFIRKQHKTNPWKVGIVVKEAADPDFGGTLLEKAAATATPAGVKPYILHGVSRSAKVLFSPEDFADRLVATKGSDIYSMRLPVDAGADFRLKFMEDEMATGRNLVLWDYATTTAAWLHGGGIGVGKYFDGNAFYTGATRLLGEAGTSTNVTGDIDIRLLISDMRIDAGADRILMSQDASGNKWQLEVDTGTGYLRLKWMEDLVVQQDEVSTAAPDWSSPIPFWIRATLDVDNGSSDAEVKFWTKSFEAVEWQQLGDTVLVGATTNIYSAASAGPQVATIYDTTNGGLECIIYIAEFYDGIDGTLAWRVDLTDTSNSELTTGVVQFSDVGPDPKDVNVGSWSTSESDYRPIYAVLHDHTGTDYFYFGLSPYAHDTGNTPNNGDTLDVDMGSSNTYYWRIEFMDGTNTQGNETTQTITWDADDHGGTSIASISVKTGSQGGTEVGRFVPSLVSSYEDNGDTADGDDTYGNTWTLTRAWTLGEYYEASYVVDRPSVNVLGSPTSSSREATVRLGGFGSGSDRRVFRHGPQSYMVVYRHWDPNEVSAMFDSIINLNQDSSGVRLGYSGQSLFAQVSSGLRVYDLYHSHSRMGQWNMAIIRMDPELDKIEMVFNGSVVDSGDGYFPDQYAYLPSATSDYISVPHAVDFNISPTLFLTAKFYPDGPWGTGTYEIAKKWGGAGARSWRLRLVNGDLEFVHSTNGTDIADTYTQTISDPGRAVTIALLFDGDYNSSTERRWLTYVNWGDDANATEFIDQTVVAGTSTIFASNDDVELGTDFVGRIYRFRMGSAFWGSYVIETAFQNITEWSPADTSQTGQQGNTISLNGDAYIVRQPLKERYPTVVADKAIINNRYGSVSTTRCAEFSGLGIFDHYLTDDEITDLMTEYNIT